MVHVDVNDQLERHWLDIQGDWSSNTWKTNIQWYLWKMPDMLELVNFSPRWSRIRTLHTLKSSLGLGFGLEPPGLGLEVESIIIFSFFLGLESCGFGLDLDSQETRTRSSFFVGLLTRRCWYKSEGLLDRRIARNRWKHRRRRSAPGLTLRSALHGDLTDTVVPRNDRFRPSSWEGHLNRIFWNSLPDGLPNVQNFRFRRLANLTVELHCGFLCYLNNACAGLTVLLWLD